MSTVNFDKALEQLDLSQIMTRVQKEHFLSDAETRKAEQLYRQFLTLHARYPDLAIVPPKLVDFVWHEHITHTRKYMADCDALFGRYLHHTPTEDAGAAEEIFFGTTAKLYRQEFNVGLERCGAYAPSGCC